MCRARASARVVVLPKGTQPGPARRGAKAGARGSAHKLERAPARATIPGTDIELVDERLVALLEPIESVRPDPANPRKAKNVPALIAMLRRFGYSDPIVVTADGMLEAGHRRLEALTRLGATQIPVLRSRHGRIDAAAYNIAHNRSAEIVGGWDDDALRKLVATLQVEDVGAVSAAGYWGAELEKLLAPESTAPTRARSSLVKRTTCPHCGNTFET